MSQIEVSRETLALIIEIAATAERIHKPTYVEMRGTDETETLCYTCDLMGRVLWPCEPLEQLRAACAAIEKALNGQ